MIDNQLVFNSFPRSGNVYSMYISEAFFPPTIPPFISITAAVHMPQIFFVKNLENVTLFRKPEDAISSLVYMQYSMYGLSLNNSDEVQSMEDLITEMAKNSTELYKLFIKYAIENADLIYIGKFDDLVNDPVNHFKNIAKKFNKTLLPDYEKIFIESKSRLVGDTWEDERDGHIPREKSDQRKHIEQIVKSLPFIQELNQEYEEFILKYKTIV